MNNGIILDTFAIIKNNKEYGVITIIIADIIAQIQNGSAILNSLFIFSVPPPVRQYHAHGYPYHIFHELTPTLEYSKHHHHNHTEYY